MLVNLSVSKFILLLLYISYLCLESYIYQYMEACFVQYLEYSFFSFFALRIYINRWFSDTQLPVDAEVVKNAFSSPRLLASNCKSLSSPLLPICLLLWWSAREELADKGYSFQLFYVQGLGLSCSDTDGCGSPGSELQQ